MYPKIEFILVHQGRVVLSLEKSSGLSRFAKVFDLREDQVRHYSGNFEDLGIVLFISTSQESIKKPPYFIYVNNILCVVYVSVH